MLRIYKKLNPVKTKFFRLVSQSFKNKNVPISNSEFEKREKVKILITRPNHRLGNQLLLSPLIQEISNQIPNCEIDLLVNGSLSKILYKNYDSIHTIYGLPKKPFKHLFSYLKTLFNVFQTRYDIGITGGEDSNSGRIFLKLSRCKHKIFDSGLNVANRPKHNAKYPIYNFLVNFENTEVDYFEYPKIDLKLNDAEIEKGSQILQQLFNDNKRVITIFTYATGKKCLLEDWWQPFYFDLKKTFPDYNILEILPKENVSQIGFEATHYYSKELREIASVIENSEIFIGADSGMMHLAISTNTPTIGLFKVTNPEIYGPYGNGSLSVDIKNISKSQIIKNIQLILNHNCKVEHDIAR